MPYFILGQYRWADGQDGQAQHGHHCHGDKGHDYSRVGKVVKDLERPRVDIGPVLRKAPWMMGWEKAKRSAR